MVCVKCKAQISDGISFCPKCGAAVTPEKHCPKCGSVIGANTNFCTKCGTQLTGPAPVVDNGAPVVGNGSPTTGNGFTATGNDAPTAGNGSPASGNGSPTTGNGFTAAGNDAPTAKSGFRWWYTAVAIVAALLLLFLGKALVKPGASKNPASATRDSIAEIVDPYNGFINGTWTSEPAGTVTMSRPLDYEVSILSARTSHSLSTGYPCIIITYSFTNKSSYDRKFYGTVSWNAYQSDYQVAVVTDPDDSTYDELSNVSKMVSPGETTEIEIAFSVADRTIPVILIELVDNQDKNLQVQKKFTFVPDN